MGRQVTSSTFFFYTIRLPPRSTLLPCTTPSRSDTTNQIHGATGRMTGIEGGLRGLSNEFKTSFEVLSTTLTDIADRQEEIGRAHVCTPVTPISRMPPSA